MIRDEPLYKWPWTKGVTGWSNKQRAPDIGAILNGHHLIVVEITVGNRPEVLRQQKQTKYKDLRGILEQNEIVQKEGWNVADPFVIVLDEEGIIPRETREDLQQLAILSGAPNEDVSEVSMGLQQMFWGDDSSG